MCLRTGTGRIVDSQCCPKINSSNGKPWCPAPDQGCPSHGPASNPVTNKACRICAATPEECFQMNQGMWPDHCLADGDWVFPPNLERFHHVKGGDLPEVIIKLAKYPFIDAYSAFYDNAKQVKTELDDILLARSITTIYIAGLATDYTVKESAIDAISLGYKVKLITNAVRPVDSGLNQDGSPKSPPAGGIKAIHDMQEKGVEMITAASISQ
jgi:nicotinamidase-related amidase